MTTEVTEDTESTEGNAGENMGLGDIMVDEDMEPHPELNRITNAILGAAIEVHRTLGPGFPEGVYGNALGLLLNFNVRRLKDGIKRIAA